MSASATTSQRLFKSEGSVYRRYPIDLDADEDDENVVDLSLPATPVDEVKPNNVDVDGGIKQEEEEELKDVHDEVDERQCRICFCGVEEELELGRLISPCLCSGSMRYVHVSCINTWRGTGTNKNALNATINTISDVCLATTTQPYLTLLSGTLISGLATSRPILVLMTTLLFQALAVSTGQFVLFLTRFSPNFVNGLDVDSTIQPMTTGFFDDFGDGPVVYYRSSGLLVDLITSSVRVFSELSEALPSSSSFVIGFGVRFLLGLAVLGSLSFASLLFSLSLFGPLQLLNNIRATPLFRRGRNRDGDTTSAGQWVIIAFVAIGILNTIRHVYSATQSLTQRLLFYLETQILEVNPEERRRHREGWLRRWIRLSRWKQMDGWRELGYWIKHEVDVRSRARWRAWFGGHE
ncbi:hypothetical protein P7C73_g4592, partial [Tremellales sp. Uapishka_1]